MNSVPAYDEFVKPLLDFGEPSAPPEKLLLDLEIDSLDVVEWIDTLGEHFGSDIEAEVVDRMDTMTLGDLYDLCFGQSGTGKTGA